MDSLEAVIEQEIDKNGLHHVLILLECICSEKAEHIRSSWQDNTTAKPWDKLSRHLGKVARLAADELP